MPSVSNPGNYNVLYGPPPLAGTVFPTDLPQCSHFLRKVTCDDKAFYHWPTDRPYVKEDHPTQLLGHPVDCPCPRGPDGKFVARSSAISGPPHHRVYLEFGEKLFLIPREECDGCKVRKPAKRDYNRKRKSEDDQSPEKKRKPAPRAKGKSGTNYDPLEGARRGTAAS